MADESRAGTDGPPPGGDKADPATVFAALAEIIYQGSDANEMYAAICIAATLTVRGCDHASLLVREADRYVTVGASDKLAREIDELERRASDGPCIDAIEAANQAVDAREIAFGIAVRDPFLRAHARDDHEIERAAADLLDVLRVERCVERTLPKQIAANESCIANER